MNICFLVDYWPVCGGVETVTRFLANEFSKIGNKVFVVYFKDFGKIDNPNFISRKLPNGKDINSIENINILSGFLKENKSSIVICQFKHLISLAFEAKKEMSIKLIYCHHNSLIVHTPVVEQGNIISLKSLLKKICPNLFYSLRIKKNKYKQIYAINKVYNKVDAFVLLSDKFSEQFRHIFFYKKLEKLHSIPNPLPGKVYENLEIHNKQKKILFVGRIYEVQKRILLIIKFWQKIYDKHNDWNLTIVGDGPDIEKIKKKAENLPRIQFEGFKEPKKYYKESSIFLMTSAFEGLPMTLIESQNFGCVPVVMNSFASLPDIIQNGENGFIVPNNDLNTFTEKVCILINDMQLRENMAKNSIESVKKFSIENIMDKWKKLFEGFT